MTGSPIPTHVAPLLDDTWKAEAVELGLSIRHGWPAWAGEPSITFQAPPRTPDYETGLRELERLRETVFGDEARV